jgi:hypothetical protein
MIQFTYFLILVAAHQMQLYRDTGVAGVQVIEALRGEMPAFTLALNRRRPSEELMRELTRLSAKDDQFQRSRFCTVVKALAYRQGINPGELPGNTGRAVPVNTGRRYVLIMLEMRALAGGPGAEAQQILLADQRGEILDRIGCSINSNYGTLRTEVLDKPGKDGARLAIQFEPWAKEDWLYWQTVNHKGESYTFRYEEPERGAPRPLPPWKDGLCRIAIKDGKFVCVFPKLVKPDPERVRR